MVGVAPGSLDSETSRTGGVDERARWPPRSRRGKMDGWSTDKRRLPQQVTRGAGEMGGREDVRIWESTSRIARARTSAVLLGCWVTSCRDGGRARVPETESVCALLCV